VGIILFDRRKNPPSLCTACWEKTAEPHGGEQWNKNRSNQSYAKRET
jgi:hypothetical protein